MTKTGNSMDCQRIAQADERSVSGSFPAQDEADCERSAEEIIGESPKLRTAMQQAGIVAPTDSTVLILGETGTGKGLMANMIHNLRSRRHHAFVKVNCAA